MSGGRFDYRNDDAANSVFHYGVYVDYGLGDTKWYPENAKAARKLNPFEDRQLSELAYDFFCLLHSLDWYLSGDNCEETYRRDVKYFKEKWLKQSGEALVKLEIEKSLMETRKELYEALFPGREHVDSD